MTATETSLYEATRYAWKISKSKAKQAEVILATRKRLVVGAFIAPVTFPSVTLPPH